MLGQGLQNVGDWWVSDEIVRVLHSVGPEFWGDTIAATLFVDNLGTVAVPEPAVATTLMAGLGLVMRRRR